MVSWLRPHLLHWRLGAAERSFAAQLSGIDRLAGAGIALATALLIGGLTLPMMSIDRLYLFEQRVSILDTVMTLVQGGEWALGAIIGLFSIVFPGLKLALAWRLWRTADTRNPHLGRRLQALSQLGKWSMLDVFLVAILVAAVKISLVSDVHLHYGLYLFVAAIILSTAICQRLAVLAGRLHGRAGEAGA